MVGSLVLQDASGLAKGVVLVQKSARVAPHPEGCAFSPMDIVECLKSIEIVCVSVLEKLFLMNKLS